MRLFVIKCFLVSLLLVTPSLYARTKLQGIVEKGGQVVVTQGMQSSTKSVRTYPAASVAVYVAGTSTLTTLYSTASGTSKPNPFTAGSDASWAFFIDDGTYDITFTPSAVTPWTLSSIFVGGAAGVSITTPPPSGGDDYVTLQTIISANVSLGAFIQLQQGIYLLSHELLVSGGSPAHLAGVGINNGTPGTIIKSTTTMRSVLALQTQFATIDGIEFDANRLANYGMYIGTTIPPGPTSDGAGLGRITSVIVRNALFDGFHQPVDTFNDNIEFLGCWSVNNGILYRTAGIASQYISPYQTTVTGTATVTASNTTITIVGSSTDFSVLGIRKGDPVRTGSGVVTADSTYVGLIDHVTSNTIVLQVAAWNLPVAAQAGSGLAFAIGVGDGFHASRSANTNTDIVMNGIYRGNAGAGLRFIGLFGPTAGFGALVDTNGFWGYSLGEADNLSEMHGAALIRPYTESNPSNTHGDYFIGIIDELAGIGATRGVGRYVGGGGASGIFTRNNGFESLLSGEDQDFRLVVTRNAGVVKHQITAEKQGFNSQFVNKVNGASGTLAVTPTNSTFTAGVGLVSGVTSVLVFDTPGKWALADAFDGVVFIEEQQMSAAPQQIIYKVTPDILSITFGGVTRNRLVLYLSKADGSGLVNWDTALAGTNGDFIAVRVKVRIK